MELWIRGEIMIKNEIKKKPLTRLLTLILIVSFSFTLILPSSTSAATKEYEIYKKIKAGMTATEVSKIIYGKSYKKHLKKFLGVTTFNSEPIYADVRDGRHVYEFSFFESERKIDNSSIFNLSIGLFSKKNGGTLYVGYKNYQPDNTSKTRLYKSKKPTLGMSMKQLDNIAYGKKLGTYYAITYENMTFLKFLDNKGKNIHPTKKTTVSYMLKSYDGKTEYLVYLDYNYKKKEYYVTMIF